MCGIVGELNFDSERPVQTERLQWMCRLLEHRGPDDEGIFVDRNFGMGMRRLSIIDLETGKQPVHNEDKSVWVVFNGEIYNYLELRQQLIDKGHDFYSRTDTEVIVHLYEERGVDLVSELRGMFGLSLWDRKQRILLLARDRVGIKPVFYRLDTTGLTYASELKALLGPECSREINIQALHDFLSYNYIPGPNTVFAGIYKLPAGHRLVCRDGRVSVDEYWDVRPRAERKVPATEEELSANLIEHLRDSVRSHLMSDVPLGVFLSGGVDSSAIVALASEITSPVKTFSIGFDDKSFNELDRARKVSAHFNTDHHELVVKPDAIHILPKLVRCFDEPFADSSAVPVYYVAQLARDQVKVVLSGEGGDEVFAGYETYSAWKLASLYKRLPRWLSAGLIPAAVQRLPVSHKKISFDYKAKRFVDGALLPPLEAHFAWKVIFSEDAKTSLCRSWQQNGLQPSLRVFEQHFKAMPQGDVLSRLQYVDMKVYLPDDILVKVDRMTMAHSLEARVPFLDHLLVEFATSLPSRWKLKGFKKKYLLKKVLAQLLPKEIIRGRKRGFNVPIPAWLSGPLQPLVRDVLSSRHISETGFLDEHRVEGLLTSHFQKRADYSRQIWGLLILMLWREAFLVSNFPSADQFRAA
jgi:asparagine synthase (glutamine-hydrolysing)